MVGYGLLGACWLVWKTEGPLQAQAVRYATRLAIALALVIAAVSLATTTLEPRYHERWLAWPNIAATAPVPLATGLAFLLLYRSLMRGKDVQPFFWALAVFGLCLLGLGISIWPDVIPARVSIWQAAAPHRSQVFMLAGASVLVPIILVYTGCAYWVFRGKVGGQGYH
jgi:cytochrome d ubiquinol oxidase subunit II